MVTESTTALTDIGYDLTDIEDKDFTIKDVECGDFSLVWWDNVCALKKIFSLINTLSAQELAQYNKTIQRIRATKEKILALGLEYPDFIDE